ncbi:Hypothetical protein A7982_08037 [Minicystis rosea]|nr:Hypothetical protein A7982_08037 [Minicystis rosea]
MSTMSTSSDPKSDSDAKSTSQDILRAIDEDEALGIANGYVQRLSERMHEDMDPEEPSDDRLIIVDEHTIEKPYGWVFFYDTEEHHLHDTPGSGIGGNAPFLVEKIGGRIRVLDGRQSVKRHLAAYEKTLPLRDVVRRAECIVRDAGLEDAVVFETIVVYGTEHVRWSRNMDGRTRHLRVGLTSYVDAPWDFEVLGSLHGGKDPRVGFEARRDGDKRYVLELFELWLVRGAEWKDLPLPSSPRAPRRRDR